MTLALEQGIHKQQIDQHAGSEFGAVEFNLLLIRMEALQLEPDEVRRIESDVFGDLAETCAHCESKVRCEQDFASTSTTGHDWENYCPKAATVMAEVMKTVMENPKYGGPHKLLHYSMYEGVRSKAARDYWDNGTCDTPSGPKSMSGPATERRGARPMVTPAPSDAARPRFVISF